MHPIWLCVFSCRRFEESFEKAQWSKVVQMQPLWLCILLCTRFENTFEETRKKSNKCDQCDYISCYASHLRTHLKTHSGKKSYKCNQCEYASSRADSLRTHLKTHSGEKSNRCNQCDFASLWAGTFGNAQRRKISQMWPMWIWIISCRQFEDAFENA